MPDALDRAAVARAHGIRPLRGAERVIAWAAFHVWCWWPFSTERRGIGHVWWWLLPWAGLWGYQDDADD